MSLCSLQKHCTAEVSHLINNLYCSQKLKWLISNRLVWKMWLAAAWLVSCFSWRCQQNQNEIAQTFKIATLSFDSFVLFHIKWLILKIFCFISWYFHGALRFIAYIENKIKPAQKLGHSRLIYEGFLGSTGLYPLWLIVINETKKNDF